MSMNNYQEKCVSQTSNEDEIVMNTKTNTTPNLKKIMMKIILFFFVQESKNAL